MIKSIFIAFKNLFTKPKTLNYPKEEIKKNDSYRGLIEYDENHCIFCLKCEKSCPPNAIIFTKNPDKTKTYHYNPYLCIYCGECVRACPESKALWQSSKKPLVGVKEDKVNDKWFELEESK